MSINTGLIGYGSWGKILAKYLDESATFNLKYIFGRSLTKAGRQTNELSDILGDPDVRAVVVATPIGTHYGIVKQALESGKHVFCEKPLCIFGADAEQLRDMAKERELSLFVDLTYTFSPALELALYYLNSGKIGDLVHIDIVIKKFLKSRQTLDVYWMLAVHALSIVDKFCGLEDMKYLNEPYTLYDAQVESVSISWSSGIGAKGSIALSMNYPARQTEVILYGTEGTIMYNPYGKDWTLRLYKRANNNTIDIYTDESNNVRHALATFAVVLLCDYPSNVDTTIKITKIIEGIL